LAVFLGSNLKPKDKSWKDNKTSDKQLLDELALILISMVILLHKTHPVVLLELQEVQITLAATKQSQALNPAAAWHSRKITNGYKRLECFCGV
jgi:hypothetical protein